MRDEGYWGDLADQLGVQPPSGPAVRNLPELLRAIYERRLRLVSRVLHFPGERRLVLFEPEHLLTYDLGDEDLRQRVLDMFSGAVGVTLWIGAPDKHRVLSWYHLPHLEEFWRRQAALADDAWVQQAQRAAPATSEPRKPSAHPPAVDAPPIWGVKLLPLESDDRLPPYHIICADQAQARARADSLATYFRARGLRVQHVDDAWLVLRDGNELAVIFALDLTASIVEDYVSVWKDAGVLP